MNQRRARQALALRKELYERCRYLAYVYCKRDIARLELTGEHDELFDYHSYWLLTPEKIKIDEPIFSESEIAITITCPKWMQICVPLKALWDETWAREMLDDAREQEKSAYQIQGWLRESREKEQCDYAEYLRLRDKYQRGGA